MSGDIFCHLALASQPSRTWAVILIAVSLSCVQIRIHFPGIPLCELGLDKQRGAHTHTHTRGNGAPLRSVSRQRKTIMLEILLACELLFHWLGSLFRIWLKGN